jgi:hypothetical protein
MHDDLDWDWRPDEFKPPFTIVLVGADEYRIMAQAKGFRWEVVSIHGTQEDAMRLRDLVELRYQLENQS